VWESKISPSWHELEDLECAVVDVGLGLEGEASLLEWIGGLG
jgi:hypothetical protein